MSTNKVKVDRKKQKNYSREELLKLPQEELVYIIVQLQSSNLQLKNVILKKGQIGLDVEGPKKGRPFDFSRYQTRRIILRIAYLGANYRGLAVQEDCADTIETHLFSALTKSCLIKCREESSYHRCGRTDKGVSASGQVISIQVRSRLSVEELKSADGGCDKELQYCKILNRLLPEDIRAISWAPALVGSDGQYYSARFDCKQRTYKYWFPRGSLNIDNMRTACKQLVGSWDFRNLCKMDVANGVTTFIRDLTHASIVKENCDVEDKEGYDMYYLLIKANAFLWHQIRCIAGVLFLVGKGYEEPNIISQLLDVDANPRKPQYNMAIDLPLNLYHCSYEFLEEYNEIYCKQSTTNIGDLNCENDDLLNTGVKRSDDITLPMDTSDTTVSSSVDQTKWFVDLQDLQMVIKSFQIQWSKEAIKAAMIKDIIKDLECLYNNSERKMSCKDPCEDIQHKFVTFSYQSDCLLEGVKPKVYQPLLKRSKCESLENRIEHYVKKRRLKKLSETEDTVVPT